MAFRPLAACLAAIPGQVPVVFRSPAASLDQVRQGWSVATLDQVEEESSAQLDASPQEEESGSVAKFPAEVGLEAQSHQIQEAAGAPDAQEDVVAHDQDGQEPEVNRDQDGPRWAVILDQDDRVLVDRNQDLPDERDEMGDYRANYYQDERRDHRYSTKFRRGLMPY